MCWHPFYSHTMSHLGNRYIKMYTEIDSQQCILRFKACCDRALRGSLLLASLCSGKHVNNLEATYRKRCQEDDIFSFAVLDEEADDDLQNHMDTLGKPAREMASADDRKEGKMKKTACEEFLSQMLDPAERIEEPEESGETLPSPSDSAHDFEGLPDADILRNLLEEKIAAEPFGCEAKSPDSVKQGKRDYLPSSLLEAMQMRGCSWNAIFRLIVRLRSAAGGSDLMWLKNPRNCRKASKGLNWFQRLSFDSNVMVLQKGIIFEKHSLKMGEA